MRKMLASIAASALILGVGGGLAASVASPGPVSASTASTSTLKGLAKDKAEENFLARLKPHTVTVPTNGDICGGITTGGGDCWWETAIQLWYNMKHGTNESTELTHIYSQFGGDFQDNWTDDNAWWGIAWQEAGALYSNSTWTAKATAMWTWDTTPPTGGLGNGGWDTACGGSTYQWNVPGGPPGHSGQQYGSENDISRAALGVLASALGKSSSVTNASNWIYQYMQGSTPSAAAAENLNPGTCTAQGTAELGGQTESWKTEQLASGSGKAGLSAAATSEYPDSDYNGQFNLLYTQYIG